MEDIEEGQAVCWAAASDASFGEGCLCCIRLTCHDWESELFERDKSKGGVYGIDI